MAEQFRLYLLGGFRLERDGQEIALPRAKVKTLLAYLALHSQEHPRETLATLFWGDVTDEQARASLRVALNALRKEIHSDLIHADRETVQLNPDAALWTDARVLGDWRLEIGELSFRKEREISSLQSLISLYQGELLAGFYDEWIEPEREKYRAKYLELLLRVVEQYRAASDYANAMLYARKMLETDRAHETAHQHLIFLYAAQGDRAGALKQFEECVRVLNEELGVEPSPETIALAKQINKKPTTKSEAAAQTNLPKPLTSFVGRERELEEIREMLGGERREEGGARVSLPSSLLTLTGPGGSGKTRLAIQAGRALSDSFPDGVWWVELAALADASLVPEQIAKSVGAQPQPNEPIEDALATFFRARELLLILDNCEHVIDACAQLVNHLITQSPNLFILATSREPLNIAGEQMYPVAPLDLPRAAIAAFATNALEFSAVRLFVERARLANPRFELNEQNVLPLVQICTRLDGIPLAIELAAARVKQMNVSEIAARLDSRFDLLVGTRTAVPRQQTLRALIDWSYNLLDAPEQNLFRQLAVFAGGWTLEAVEQVTGDGVQGSGLVRANPYSTPSDTLLHLVDKSLVVVEMDAAETRYRLLETIREYALEKLRAAGGEADARAKHLEYFVEIAEDAAPRLWGREALPALNRLEREHDNFRAALRFALDSNDTTRAIQFAGALGDYWHLRNYAREGEKWCAQIIERDDERAPLTVRARLYSGAGTLAWDNSDFLHAEHLHRRALELYQAAGDAHGIAFATSSVGTQLSQVGKLDQATRFLTEALEMGLNTHDDRVITFASNNLGTIGAPGTAEAEAYFRQAFDAASRAGDALSMGAIASNLAELARLRGDFARALTLAEQALVSAYALGNVTLIRHLLGEQGLALAQLGQLDAAHAALLEALQSAHKAHDLWGIGATISRLAFVEAQRGNPAVRRDFWATAKHVSNPFPVQN